MRTKNLKKVLALFLAVISIVSCFAICASAATTKTETAGYVGPSPNGAVTSIPCCWKKWVTTGTCNGTLTSFNTIGRNSSNRYYEASAKNSKTVTKMVAKVEAQRNSTGATLDEFSKSLSNTNEISASKWVYSGATYAIYTSTTTETRAADSFAEYIEHIY